MGKFTLPGNHRAGDYQRQKYPPPRLAGGLPGRGLTNETLPGQALEGETS